MPENEPTHVHHRPHQHDPSSRETTATDAAPARDPARPVAPGVDGGVGTASANSPTAARHTPDNRHQSDDHRAHSSGNTSNDGDDNGGGNDASPDAEDGNRPPVIDLEARRHPDINTPARRLPAIVWAMDAGKRARLRDHAGPCIDVVALWNCPVCERSVPRYRRPGRHAVYCTNSCKQKAYRHRCIERNRRMLELARDPRPQRARTRDGVHAIRETNDRATGRRDSIGRGVTMCGAFATMSIDNTEQLSHTRFLATAGPSEGRTCERCVQLSASPVHQPDVVLRAILRRRSERPERHAA